MEYVVEYPQVLSIEKVAKTFAFNYEARWIIESSIPEEKPWFKIGITGKNQIVQVADTGVDLDHCYLRDDGEENLMFTTDWDLTPLEKKIDTTRRKVIQFVKLEGFGDSFDNDSGHGTHVIASIVGQNLDSNDPLANGVASDAKICFFDSNVDLAGKSVKVPEKISSLFYFGRKAGARIHSASWGSGSSGTYNIKSQQIDEYFHDDFFDRMVTFVAGGNDGQELDPNKNRVCDQCVSKNVICIGASYNSEELRNVVASFSSHGFTEDNRIKPDILAPGRAVLSARANSNGECDPSNGLRPVFDHDNKDEPHDGLVYKSGTSLSCPIAAGSGALVRQYFLDGYYPTGSKQEQDTMDISGTLLKAILINGGEKMNKRSKSFDGEESLNNETDFVDSDFYDKYQGFGKVNLLNSLKHPDTEEYESPDLYVVNEKDIEQGFTHEYKFLNMCDDHDFRVTLIWRDPRGTSGCAECLVNDLDLKVTLETTDEIFYPNGKSNKDSKNNVERVIIDRSSFSDPATVLVKVTAADIGYNEIDKQKYSLVATGCFDNGEIEFDGPDLSPICEEDQFEYTIELFTNRRSEETSWLFQYQGSGGIIAAAIADQYDEILHLYRETGCATVGQCFIFTIKDTEFNGLCCEKGMGSYLIRDGKEILLESKAFVNRQETHKFCHLGSDVTESLSSTILCNEDEFKYELEINTDIFPDETRWELRRHIDGVDEGTYTESYKDYEHEGCLDLGGCFIFSVYDNIRSGEYTITANDFVVADQRYFFIEETNEFCYAGESTDVAPTYGIQTAVIGGTEGEKFDDVHSPWKHGNIKEIELYTISTTYSSYVYFIGITYENGEKYEHGEKLGTQHIITLGEDQYITKVSGFAGYDINQLVFETNDGEVIGPYGCIDDCDDDYDDDFISRYTFEFDFGGNVLVYIFGRTAHDSFKLSQLGFTHASLPQTRTDSPTSQPTAFPCYEGQFRYQIIIRTHNNPEGIWWELYPEDFIIDSVPFMTYKKQLESYSHTGCLSYDECYKFRVYDKRHDGLCCYFGSGAYKLSVDNNVILQGNHFDDATHAGEYWDPDSVFNKHEFCYDRQPSEAPPSFAVQPTSKPTEMICSDDEFEYRIRVRTNSAPWSLNWEFINLNTEDVIESVDFSEYFLQNYEYNHRGCITLDECYEFYTDSSSIVYTVFVDDIIMVEGDNDYIYYGWEKIKTCCYGPSYSKSPSLAPTSSSPTIPLVCDENEFEYGVVVTTDEYPEDTSWELSYDDGTLIDTVEVGYYTERYTEHIHKGCLDLNSCVIFTLFDSLGYGLCCWFGNGGYTIIANNNIMVEGGYFYSNETKTFCYGPSISSSPSFTNQICESGSNNNDHWCVDWASIGLCDDNKVQDWMQENCEKAYANCCMDYDDRCDYYYDDGRCTDTSQYWDYDFTWQEFMQASCRVSCDTCDLDFTPSSTTPPVTCSDDQFKYEIVVTNDDYYYFFEWYFYYKYPDLVDGYEIPEGFDEDYYGIIDAFYLYLPPGYEKTYYGCASYSCFDLDVDGYLKMYDVDTGTFIAQNTERYEKLRFCHYDLKEVIFTVTLKLSRFPSDNKEEVEDISRVIQRSIKKILFRAQTDDENLIVVILGSSCNEENKKCELIVEVCKGFFCEGEEPVFRSIVGNTLTNLWKSDEFLTITQYMAHFMNVDIFDESTEILSIVFDFEYESWPTTAPTVSTPECNQNLFSIITSLFQPLITKDYNDHMPDENPDLCSCADAISCCGGEVRDDDNDNDDDVLDDKYWFWVDDITIDDYWFWDDDYYEWDDDLYTPTTSPTTLPSSTTSTQDCDMHIIVQTMFGVIASLLQPITQTVTQGINNTIPDTLISNVLLGVNTFNSTAIPCTDRTFLLQLEFVTDWSPNRSSWELHYENGTVIDSVWQDTYAECNTTYYYNYFLEPSCFIFNMFDSFEFKGSYNITVGETVLAQQNGFLGWKDTKHFCYLQCDQDGMFLLEIEIVTDDWPHEIYWELAHSDDGTVIDHVDARHYTEQNKFYDHRHCLLKGCYDLTFHDYIGDGICCSYGEGSYKIKINDGEIIKEGTGEFSQNKTESFCYPACEDCEGSLIDTIVNALSRLTGDAKSNE